jgi:hypothetical protein
MIDPSEMSSEELRKNSSYDPNDEEEKPLLRISKSSFIGYDMCPRKYWWEKVQLKHQRMPATPAMIRGGFVHKNLEMMYDNWDGQSVLAPLIPEGRDDIANENLVFLEECRIQKWGVENFMPDEYEVKHMVWDADYEVVLVGMIDGVLVHPDGGLCIYELKTGNMAGNKMTKTRKELCYYTRLLQLMGETRPITHFAYLCPDAENHKFIAELCGWGIYQEVDGKKKRVGWDEDRVLMSEAGWLDSDSKREVAIGKGGKGLLVIEKLNKRSITSFEKTYGQVVEGIKSHEWNMKWNDYFCPAWCEFAMSCESELNGLDNLWEGDDW